VNRLRQPSFYHAAFAFVAMALAICVVLDPSARGVAQAGAALSRVCTDAVSIVLAASVYVIAGALAAEAAVRMPAAGWRATLAIAALAPGCDCSMNGFVDALRRCPAPLAGAALTWGAVCNPVALVATATVLGPCALLARAIGGGVAAAAVAVLWLRARRLTNTRTAPHRCLTNDDLSERVERALRSLVPAAVVASISLVAAPVSLREHMSPLAAAIAGALISPCSTADPVLARALCVAPAAQAAFIVAAQCADLRHVSLMARSYGVRHALFALLSGAIGCACAASLAWVLQR
jgi:hypothetical protein